MGRIFAEVRKVSRIISRITPAMAERLTGDYLAILQREARPGAARVIDKNPLNFRNLGLIARLFPQARIIHCTRHPLDTGLSNYFQRFPLRLEGEPVAKIREGALCLNDPAQAQVCPP